MREDEKQRVMRIRELTGIGPDQVTDELILAIPGSPKVVARKIIRHREEDLRLR